MAKRKNITTTQLALMTAAAVISLRGLPMMAQEELTMFFYIFFATFLFLIPAALEGQITRERAEKLTCKLVLEGANGPTYPEADDVLAERGVIVVPDVICNAGGGTVSYFEWVQDMASFFWSEEEINAKMDRIMTDAIVHVWDKAAEKECTLRTAYIVACERILMARKDRGIYPG